MSRTMEGRNQLIRHLDRSLEALPAPFAQLVFLSSLRDPYTGRYLHEGWATVASASEVHLLIRTKHLVIFRQVMELCLSEICHQLQNHFRSLEGETPEMARLWLEGEPFREMIPSGCEALERKFFVSQMRSALATLVRCPDLFRPLARVAWLRQPPGQQPPHRLET